MNPIEPDALSQTLNQLMHDERAQLLAILIKQISDIELAEDALQEALGKAWTHWQTTGTPKHPKSWILKTAYNQAIDQLRRHQSFTNKQPLISHLHELQHELSIEQDDSGIADERLRLIFSCCHPALDDNIQVALTLNTVCGFTAEQVAQAYMINPATMSQRLVRAKRKIKLSAIPYEVPKTDQFAERLNQVLKVIYLIFNAGYYAQDRANLIDLEHTDEALYLAETLNTLMPEQAEVLGLMALMRFHQSRLQARTECNDQFVSLEQQNRQLWDRTLISEANQWFQQAINCQSMGPYQIQAAISGVHSQALTWQETDWPQIVALYEKMLQYQPSDTVRINQAVALSYAGQVDAAWQLLQSIDTQQLKNYLPYYLAHAQIAKLRAEPLAAASSFAQAMALSNNPQEQDFIQQQIDLLQ